MDRSPTPPPCFPSYVKARWAFAQLRKGHLRGHLSQRSHVEGYLATTRPPHNTEEAVSSGLLGSPLLGTGTRAAADWCHAWSLLGQVYAACYLAWLRHQCQEKITRATNRTGAIWVDAARSRTLCHGEVAAAMVAPQSPPSHLDCESMPRYHLPRSLT